MKKFLILCVVMSFGFADWVMFKGPNSGGQTSKYLTNAGTVTFIYNTKNGKVYKYDQIISDPKSMIPAFEGFREVPYIKAKYINGKFKNFYLVPIPK